jgi:hydroxymethylpyrimidine kinase/phosphomethylpyrimidine kinase
VRLDVRGARPYPPPVRIALTIAGSDPTGAAGLQADLQVFRAHGVHGAGVLTALNVQDTGRVHRVLPAFPSVVLDQLRVVLRDFAPHAVKIGQLASDDVARNVLLGLGALATDVPVVVDPVLAASDGTPLLERRGWGSLVALCARAALVTPNLPEAQALSGTDVSTRAGVEAAGRRFVEEMGARAALVKGGHADGPPDDLLALRDDDRAGKIALRWLPGERIGGGGARGTGCALSAAVAAHLARGESLETAVERARAFVAEALRRAIRPGPGAAGRVLVYG